MPTNRTPLQRRRRRLSPGAVKSLLEGPEAVLPAGSGYYNCGCAQIRWVDASERRAAEAAMLADWLAHRPHLLAIWRGRASDPNAGNKWFRINRVPGPCWAERHLETAGADNLTARG